MKKQALDAKQIISSAWRDSEGPFENTLRILSYSPVLFFGIGGLLLTIADKLASWLGGYGVEDLGRKIDELLGKKPKSPVAPNDFAKLEKMLLGAIEARAQLDGQMLKVAGLGGVLKMLGGIGKFVKIFVSLLSKAVAFIALTYGASNIGDIYGKVKEKGKEVAKDVAKEMIFEDQGMGDIADLFLGNLKQQNRS